MTKLIRIESPWTALRTAGIVLLVMASCWTAGEQDPALGLAYAAGSEWIPFGQPVKAYPSTFTYVDASRHALNPSLVFTGAVPMLGWNEMNVHGISQVYVGHWEGSGWATERAPQNMDGTHRAFDLTMGSDGKIPYLAWVELNGKNIPQLYVKHQSEGHWIVDEGSLNLDPSQGAANPALSAGGPIPYLAWCEYSPQRVFQLYVKHRSADGWHRDGNDSLNISPARDAIKPAIALQGSVVYLAWAELSDQNFYQVYVKRWDGSKWDLIGQSLNMNPERHALNPSIAILGPTPYVAWIETDENGIFQLHVKHWDQGRWVVDGRNLNVDPGRHAMSPSLVQAGSSVYLAWMEYDARGISQVHVKHRAGDRWESDDQRLNVMPPTASSAPSLAAWNGGIYIAWKEVYPNGLAQIVVKHLASR